MRSTSGRAFIACAILAGSATFAHAQQSGPPAQLVDVGKQEYATHCAVCHGVSGKGDGVYADLLKSGTVVPNLTELSKKNDRVFPYMRVYQTIDGTQDAKAHGTKEMPIWGNRYRIEAGQGFYDAYSDAYVHARILALTEYIYRIQAK